MPSAPAPNLHAREWAYHVLILALGLILAAVMGVDVVRHGADRWFATALLVGVPLIAVIARFPMVLDSGSGAIEVGFESCVLMFLLCMFDAAPALAVWSLGVLLTQALAETRASARTFNIGIGIVSGGLAAAAYGLVSEDVSIETVRQQIVELFVNPADLLSRTQRQCTVLLDLTPDRFVESPIERRPRFVPLAMEAAPVIRRLSVQRRDAFGQFVLNVLEFFR